MLVSRIINPELEYNKLTVSHNEPLVNVGSYYHLGINIDRKGSFEGVVSNAYVRAHKKLYTLTRIRPYI